MSFDHAARGGVETNDYPSPSSEPFAPFVCPQKSNRKRSVAKLEAVIREAIARGARRQVRVVVTPLRRKMGELHGELMTLRRSAAGWKRLVEAAPAIPHVSEEDAKAARLSPRL